MLEHNNLLFSEVISKHKIKSTIYVITSSEF